MNIIMLTVNPKNKLINLVLRNIFRIGSSTLTNSNPNVLSILELNLDMMFYI